MARILYELAAEDDARFSPYCWRTRFALAHKRLDAEMRGLGFLEIPQAVGAPHRTVPLLDDDGHVVSDSWAIALYLEDKYPGASLWNFGQQAMGLYRALDVWANQVLVPAIVPLAVLDIHSRIRPADRAYFRESREKRLGMALEQAAGADPATRVDAVRKLLAPVRDTLVRQQWLGGSSPDYADYIVAGTLQWPRVICRTPLLSPEDPVAQWFERCLDLFDGLGRWMPAAPIAATSAGA